MKVLCSQCGKIVNGNHLFGDANAPVLAGAHNQKDARCVGSGCEAKPVKK